MLHFDFSMPTITETIENAVQYHQGGHLQLAEKLYRMVLQRDPDNPVALHSLGVIAHQKEKDDMAVELIGKAIANNPQIPQFHNTLGLVLESLEKFEEAIAAYQQAVSIKPDYAEAYQNMAVALQSQQKYVASVEKCNQAVLLKPNYSEAYNTMGFSLEKQEKYDEAIENYKKAIQFKPDFAEAYNHLGVVLNAQERSDEALENYKQALQLDTDYTEVHWNMSLVLLRTGRLTEGWKEYEWRRNPELGMTSYPHCYQVPRWDGQTFTGKTLLVHYEQGLGDTLHFVRYLPMVKARGGTVILEVRKPLCRLLQGFPGVDELVEASLDNKPATKFDYHVSLMDLPKIFATTLETIPAEVPYIRICPMKVEYWRKKLAGPDFKVGIVWAGSPTHEKDRYRSCTLKCFAPLTKIKGVQLYGLQKGDAAAQMDELAKTMPVINISKEFEDFADTAAAIENLDIVLSVDTAVLHLAGAMGKPAWALLAFSPDWRWMLDRQDSPWYPTMKLFRQKKWGQWEPLFQRVAEELRIMTAKNRIASHKLQRSVAKAVERRRPSQPLRRRRLNYGQEKKTQDIIQHYKNNAIQHHQSGHLQKAEQLYRLILENDPDNPIALHSLGVIAHQRGKHDKAVELIGRTIENNPQIPQFHNTLGLVFEALGKFEEAVAAYQRAASIKPDYAEAYYNNAVALQSQGQYSASVEKCKQALSLKPDYAEAYNLMGFSLEQQGRHTEAIENYRHAIRVKPDFAEAYYNLANTLQDGAKFTEAIANFEQAIRLKPDFVEAYYNLAKTLQNENRCDEAIENYRQSIRLRPDLVAAQWHLSRVLLLSGRFEEGWSGYGWWRSKLNPVPYPHCLEKPYWDGSSFTGKRLFVHYEQGLGDNIQFIRYLPMVKARGGTVIFEASKPMLELLRGFAGIDELVEASFGKKPAVEFDLHTPLLGLPRIFETTLETIPADVPYLHADPVKVEYWKNRLPEGGFKVGIVWAGLPLHGNDHNRSCHLRHFSPLAQIPGVHLYSLQKGRATGQISELSGTMAVKNLGSDFEDFADTAAAIENLDLVISVDTSVLHLAGAMGKPVWALLPFSPDWRWMLDRRDSPWYPTMKLFRQKNRGQWEPVFKSVAEELRIMAVKYIIGNHRFNYSQKKMIPAIIPYYKNKNQLEKCKAALKKQTVENVEIFIRNN